MRLAEFRNAKRFTRSSSLKSDVMTGSLEREAKAPATTSAEGSLPGVAADVHVASPQQATEAEQVEQVAEAPLEEKVESPADPDEVIEEVVAAAPTKFPWNCM